jgi:hypothetical protein
MKHDDGTRLILELAARRAIISDGFRRARPILVPEGAPECQLNDIRNAYYAGAMQLWAAITLTPGGAEQGGFQIMDALEAEMHAFISSRIITEGSA